MKEEKKSYSFAISVNFQSRFQSAVSKLVQSWYSFGCLPLYRSLTLRAVLSGKNNQTSPLSRCIHEPATLKFFGTNKLIVVSLQILQLIHQQSLEVSVAQEMSAHKFSLWGIYILHRLRLIVAARTLYDVCLSQLGWISARSHSLYFLVLLADGWGRTFYHCFPFKVHVLWTLQHIVHQFKPFLMTSRDIK